jgi:hypothetical protein
MGEMAMYVNNTFINLDLLIPISASVYHEICNCLLTHGFTCTQYSIWHHDATTATAMWAHMLYLRDIHPQGILVTVVQHLQMFHIPLPNLFITTDNIQLGGIYSPTLIGLTPMGLSQGMGGAPPPLWPNGIGDELPFRVQPHNATYYPNNWNF